MEAVTDGKTLREEEGGPRPGSPQRLFSLLCCLVLGFGMGDFGKYKNAQ
jgi:hypothetical protein